jgi:penicillin-binding protein 2
LGLGGRLPALTEVRQGRRRLRLPATRRGGFVTPRPAVPRPLSVVEEDFFASVAFYRRVAVLGVVAVVAFAMLALRAWSLQVLHHAQFVTQSSAQATRVVNLPAGRGAIVDALGRPLATVGAQVVVIADASALGPQPYGATWTPSTRGLLTLRRLARIAHVPASKLVARIRASLVQSPFGPAVVVSHVRRALGFYLDEHAEAFPGVHVVGLPTRLYPQGRVGGTFLGLLGPVSGAELKEERYAHAKAGETVGQSGVEATYDRYLNGGFAHARVRVDAQGAIASPLRVQPQTSVNGRLELTVDSRVQRAAERAIQSGIRYAHTAGYPDANAGAAVVLDTRTGAVKALASYPTVNPVAAASDAGYLERLVQGRQPGSSLIDLATQGLFPAGSTFKPIVAEAALASGLITPEGALPCTGSLTVGGLVFHNVEPAVDSMLTLPQALAMSCDTWFYRVGERLYGLQLDGRLALQQWARRLGLGRPTGIDLPGESGGVVPTPAWLRATFAGTAEELWYEGTSVNLSIGQGYLAITPLQLAVAYAALANGGTVVRPHLGAALTTANGRRQLAFPPRRRVRLVDVAAIRSGLWEATHAADGTSTSVFGTFRVPVAGKTGTAEVPHGSDDSWFASWAPAAHPRYVVVVLIVHGGFGADAAAPAARDIYQALFPPPRRVSR